MRSNVSTCAGCCSNPRCSRRSNPISTSSRCSSSSTACCPTRRGRRRAPSSPGCSTDLEQRLTDRTRQAVDGALARANRSRRPRPGDIDWPHTVHANLRHWLPEYRTVVPERLIGYGRRRRSLARDVIIAIDQSGSMADSVVYASLFGAVLAQLPALRTHLVAFDTSVTDLTPLLHDPVDVLFGVQLGGGTDIAQALGYCRRLVTRPRDTVLVLISDLFEGGNADLLRARIAELVRADVTVLCLLALSDDGAPVHDHVAAGRPGGPRRHASWRARPTSSPTSSAMALDRGS